MARIRTVKPEFWTDSKTGTLSGNATKLFIGMMNHADDFGVIKFDTAEIKVKVFPYEAGSHVDVVMNPMVQEVIPKRLALPFEWGVGHEKCRYLLIVNLTKHQKINEACKPTIKGFTVDDLNKVLEIVTKSKSTGKIKRVDGNLSLVREGKGEERKGMEGNGKDIAPSPTDSKPPVLLFTAVGKKEWGLTEEKIAEWTEAYPGVNVLAECRKARQWCIDNPTKNKTAKGMPSFLSRWMSRAQDSGKSRPVPTIHDDQAIANAKFKKFQEREANEWAEAAK